LPDIGFSIAVRIENHCRIRRATPDLTRSKAYL